jgi:hypothetical protein
MSLPDNYVVTLTASNGCFDTTVTYTINAGLSATGIDDALESTNINWSMNGSMLDGQSRFSYTSDHVADVSLSIHDLQGKLLMEKSLWKGSSGKRDLQLHGAAKWGLCCPITRWQ